MGTELLKYTNSDTEARDPRERHTIARLREIDLENREDLVVYCNLLTHPKNIEHFSNPPVLMEEEGDPRTKTKVRKPIMVSVVDIETRIERNVMIPDPELLKEKLLNDKTHAYLAENMLGGVIGGGGINDAARGEHDHWLVKVAVDPDLQEEGIGTQLLVLLIEEAFITKAGDGRDRGKLVASIIRDVDGWGRMPHILESLGFRPLHIMLQEVDVYVQEAEKTFRKPTERWEIRRDDWKVRKSKADVKRILSPQLT